MPAVCWKQSQHAQRPAPTSWRKCALSAPTTSCVLELASQLGGFVQVQVFMISSDAEVNDELLLKILQRGHSRLPVYEGNNKQVGALGCLLLCCCCCAGCGEPDARRLLIELEWPRWQLCKVRPLKNEGTLGCTSSQTVPTRSGLERLSHYQPWCFNPTTAGHRGAHPGQGAAHG